MAVDIHCMNSPAFGEPDIDSRQCARISRHRAERYSRTSRAGPAVPRRHSLRLTAAGATDRRRRTLSGRQTRHRALPQGRRFKLIDDEGSLLFGASKSRRSRPSPSGRLQSFAALESRRSPECLLTGSSSAGIGHFATFIELELKARKLSLGAR